MVEVDGENLKVPKTTVDITPEWVGKVTGHEVVKENFTVEGDVQEGNGFLSSICRASYVTENGEGHSIIIKMLPTNEQWLEFALADASDEREISFYSKILPDIIEVVPEIRENTCQFYNGTVKKGDPTTGRTKTSMLVMEDLKSSGFQMMSFHGEQSEIIIHDLLKFMARLHYGAYAVERKKGIPLPELYPFMQGITDEMEWLEQVESLSNTGYQALHKLLMDHNYAGSWDRYEKLKPYTNLMVRTITENGRQKPCLIHGDVWPPNIQVHDTLPVKVLDWQLLGYRDVTFDLSILLCIVLPKERLTRANVTKLLKRYYEDFTELCLKGGLHDKVKERSWEEFERFFFTWGVAFLYLVMLPSIDDCYQRDLPKFANIFRFMCEECSVPEFLLTEFNK